MHSGASQIQITLVSSKIVCLSTLIALSHVLYRSRRNLPAFTYTAPRPFL